MPGRIGDGEPFQVHRTPPAERTLIPDERDVVTGARVHLDHSDKRRRHRPDNHHVVDRPHPTGPRPGRRTLGRSLTVLAAGISTVVILGGIFLIVRSGDPQAPADAADPIAPAASAPAVAAPVASSTDDPATSGTPTVAPVTISSASLRSTAGTSPSALAASTSPAAIRSASTPARRPPAVSSSVRTATPAIAPKATPLALNPLRINGYQVTAVYSKYVNDIGPQPNRVGVAEHYLYPCSGGTCYLWIGPPSGTAFRAAASAVTGTYRVAGAALGSQCDLIETWKLQRAMNGQYAGTIDYRGDPAGGGGCSQVNFVQTITMIPVTE